MNYLLVDIMKSIITNSVSYDAHGNVIDCQTVKVSYKDIIEPYHRGCDTFGASSNYQNVIMDYIKVIGHAKDHYICKHISLNTIRDVCKIKIIRIYK